MLAQMPQCLVQVPLCNQRGKSEPLTMCERGFDFLWEKKNTESNIIHSI